MWLEVEKPIDEYWARLIERRQTLDAIHAIEFEEEQVKKLTLNFTLGGMSQGKMILFKEPESKKKISSKDLKQFQIDLLGYPGPIGVKKNENSIPPSTEKASGYFR